ncbi:MAG TPA: polyhydroxyalkanoic acid system family protein [Burkholderiaceae bacterium]
MKQAIAHHLSKDEALSVAIDAFHSYEKKYAEYQPRLRWMTRYEAEVSFAIKGMKLKGSIAIDAHKIWLGMDIPFLLLPFKRLALDVIHAEITGWLRLAHSASAATENQSITVAN